MSMSLDYGRTHAGVGGGWQTQNDPRPATLYFVH